MLAFLQTTEEIILFTIACAIIASPAIVIFGLAVSIAKRLERKAKIRL